MDILIKKFRDKLLWEKTWNITDSVSDALDKPLPLFKNPNGIIMGMKYFKMILLEIFEFFQSHKGSVLKDLKQNIGWLNLEVRKFVWQHTEKQFVWRENYSHLFTIRSYEYVLILKNNFQINFM